MPAVSAPAAQTKPVEAPVTEPEAAGPPAPKKGGKKPAVAIAPVESAQPAIEKPGAAPRAHEKIHVKKGDTLETLAKQYNTSAAAIMMENNLVTATVKPGQTLKIPNHH